MARYAYDKIGQLDLYLDCSNYIAEQIGLFIEYIALGITNIIDTSTKANFYALRETVDLLYSGPINEFVSTAKAYPPLSKTVANAN